MCNICNSYVNYPGVNNKHICLLLSKATYINTVRAKSWAIRSLKCVPDVKKGVRTPSTSTKFFTPGFASDFFDDEPSQFTTQEKMLKLMAAFKCQIDVYYHTLYSRNQPQLCLNFTTATTYENCKYQLVLVSKKFRKMSW